MNNNTQKMKLAFIGGALNSAVGYTHFVSSTMDNRWVIAAGAFSRNELTNQKTADVYGVDPSHLYLDWKEMIRSEKENIDAVVILVPTPMHCEVSIFCIEHNIPVICEKSLCTNSNDAEKIYNIVHSRNAFLALTYNYSGYPMLRELKKLINNGTLGNILHFSIEMPQEGFIKVDSNGNKPTPQNWRLHDDIIPTLHLDLAVHLHQLLYYIVGKKTRQVFSINSSKGFFDGITDNCYAVSKLEDNIEGQIWFSKSALGHRNGLKLRIYGSEASAEWYQMDPEELLLSMKNGERKILDRGGLVNVCNLQRYTRFKAGHPAGFLEAFANLYNDIADALIEYKATGRWNSQEVFGVDLGLESIYFLESMMLSSNSCALEKIKTIPERILSSNELYEIYNFVTGKLQKKGRLPEGYSMFEYNYFKNGYIDSLSLIKFVVEIEEKFDITITDDDITNSRFQTVGGLIEIVSNKIFSK